MTTRIHPDERTSLVGNFSWKLDYPFPNTYRDDDGNTGSIKTEPTNSTKLDNNSIRIIIDLAFEKIAELETVFELAAGEDFEDGIETAFSRQLEKFVKDYGSVGILSIHLAISKELFSEPYIAEALLWLGDMEHERTKNTRRLLLENALDSKSVFIRDAAVSGLSYLGDPKSIVRLSEALTEEPSQGIRTNIKTVLKYLRQLAV